MPEMAGGRAKSPRLFLLAEGGPSDQTERTLREPPGAVTHSTGRAMAKAMGLLLRTIQRIWAPGSVRNLGVRGGFSHHALTNLSSNMMANWVLASHHSRGGIFHVCATWRKTRYSNLIAASSVGKCPLVRTARRDNQDENRATIRMRMRRRGDYEGRA